MGQYLAQIIQRDGVARYLVRGKLTDWHRLATSYASPSNARVAIKMFMKDKNHRDYAANIIDKWDWERNIE